METVEVGIASKIYRVSPIDKNTLVRPHPDSNLTQKQVMPLLYGNAISEIRAEFNTKTNQYLTGLTEAEARELEKEMLLEPKTLSPLNVKFWAKHKILLPYSGKTLNTSNPQDRLDIKLLLVNSKVANSKDAYNYVHADYVMTNSNDEATTYNKKFEVKAKAFAKLAEMSPTDQTNFLKIWKDGKIKVTFGHTTEQIHELVARIVDEQPKEFLHVVNMKNYNDMIFISDCIDIDAINLLQGKYYIKGEPDSMGTIVETIEFLQNPKHNTTRLSLIAKLDALKNTKRS